MENGSVHKKISCEQLRGNTEDIPFFPDKHIVFFVSTHLIYWFNFFLFSRDSSTCLCSIFLYPFLHFFLPLSLGNQISHFWPHSVQHTVYCFFRLLSRKKNHYLLVHCLLHNYFYYLTTFSNVVNVVVIVGRKSFSSSTLLYTLYIFYWWRWYLFLYLVFSLCVYIKNVTIPLWKSHKEKEPLNHACIHVHFFSKVCERGKCSHFP